jgi:hypothetical protein
MPKVILAGPLRELELQDQHAYQPLALGYLRFGEFLKKPRGM